MASLRGALFLVVLLGAVVHCHGHTFVHPLSLIKFHKAMVEIGKYKLLNIPSVSQQGFL